MTTETITWHDAVPESMPDAMMLVLIEREEAGDPMPVDTGYWDGDFWCNAFDEFVCGKVTGWADLPVGRKAGAA